RRRGDRRCAVHARRLAAHGAKAAVARHACPSLQQQWNPEALFFLQERRDRGRGGRVCRRGRDDPGRFTRRRAMNAARPTTDAARQRPASPLALFIAFSLLALQGFGGVLAVAQRELVDRRGWLSRTEF